MCRSRHFTVMLPLKKNGAWLPKQKTVTLDPVAKPLSLPTPVAKAPVLKLNPESSPKQVQLSPAGTVTVTSPVPVAATISAGTAVAGLRPECDRGSDDGPRDGRAHWRWVRGAGQCQSAAHAVGRRSTSDLEYRCRLKVEWF